MRERKKEEEKKSQLLLLMQLHTHKGKPTKGDAWFWSLRSFIYLWVTFFFFLFFFNHQDFAPVYESTCDQIPVTHRTDRRRPTKPHVWRKTSLWLLLFCMRQGSTREKKRGARGHISPPPAKINLLEDCESSMLMSLHSHVAPLCCSLGLPSCKNWN